MTSKSGSCFQRNEPIFKGDGMANRARMATRYLVLLGMANRARMATRYLVLAFLGMFLFAASHRSYGQDINATLSGTVTDPSGAVIPGAKLTLVNEATGFQSSYVSDAAGEYSFGNQIGRASCRERV